MKIVGILALLFAVTVQAAAPKTFTLRISGEPETLDWNKAHTPIETYLLMNLMEGLVSFDENMLMSNLTAVIEAVVKAKPSGAKGQYVRSAYLTTTMGPGIKLDLTPTLALSAS